MLTTLHEFIDAYGYLAVLIGTFFEGETVLILGGLAAQFGYLDLYWVMAIAFVGSLSGDQLWFVLGRWRGRALLVRYPTWHQRVDRVHDVLQRYEIPVLLGFRFVYGFRNLTPFVVGLGRTRTIKFVILNAIGALIWSVSIATAGYVFGEAVELVLGDIKRYQLWTLLAVVVAGVGLLIAHLVRRRRRARAVRPAS
jgi:membrane protein DedA with SNARE-associated domain